MTRLGHDGGFLTNLTVKNGGGSNITKKMACFTTISCAFFPAKKATFGWVSTMALLLSSMLLRFHSSFPIRILKVRATVSVPFKTNFISDSQTVFMFSPGSRIIYPVNKKGFKNWQRPMARCGTHR